MDAQLLPCLYEGWKRVRQKSSAPGLDREKTEDFAANEAANMDRLYRELIKGEYEPKPIKTFVSTERGKERELGILCVCDRIVQTALLVLIQPYFEPFFSKGSFAFRTGKSAKQAVDDICSQIEKQEGHVFRGDIKSYFDEINRDRLMAMVRRRYFDDDILDLLKKCLDAPLYMDERIENREKGICQGAPLSPFLSNIYLDDFDKKFEKDCAFYLRYCDDILIIDSDNEKIKTCSSKMREQLEQLDLSFNETKSLLGSVEAGFLFLGHYFSNNGASVTAKSVESLSEKLQILLESAYKFDNSSAPEVWDVFQQMGDVLRGWEQYYDLPKYAMDYPEVYIAQLGKCIGMRGSRWQELVENHEILAVFPTQLLRLMPSVWEYAGEFELAIASFEMLYGIGESSKWDDSPKEALALWKLCTNGEKDFADLINLYTNSKRYVQAKALFHLNNERRLIKSTHTESDNSDEITSQESSALSESKSENASQEQNSLHDLPQLESSPKEEDSLPVDTRLPVTLINAQRIFELFVSYTSAYRIERLFENVRQIENVDMQLTPSVIYDHISGEKSIDTYIGRKEVKLVVLDIDVIKRIIVDPEANFEVAYALARQIALDLMRDIKRVGLTLQLEESGHRGFHIWILFDRGISLSDAAELTAFLSRNAPDVQDTGVTVERFPNARKIRPEQTMQCIKLPYGIHPLTGQYSILLDEKGQPIRDAERHLASIEKNPASKVRNILGRAVSTDKSEKNANIWHRTKDVSEIDNTINRISELSPINAQIEAVLSGCIIIRQLCFKAKDTGFLPHSDRNHLRYVFGLMGEEGRKYIHQIMRWTFNYNFKTTEKMIDLTLESPIGCNRLKEVYGVHNLPIECNCRFPVVSGTYPSPILHAHAVGGRTAALPTHSELTEAEKTSIGNQINTHEQIQQTVEKLMDLNRQSRILDEEISSCKNTLQRLFDDLHIDSFDVKSGKLVRTTEKGVTSWKMELV